MSEKGGSDFVVKTAGGEVEATGKMALAHRMISEWDEDNYTEIIVLFRTIFYLQQAFSFKIDIIKRFLFRLRLSYLFWFAECTKQPLGF